MKQALLAVVVGVGALGCRTESVRPEGSRAAFAAIELEYEGCSCFEEVRELKLIAKELYGTFPWIDEPHQRIHIALEKPTWLDLGELVRRVDGTHARTRSLTLEVTSALTEEEARIAPTGQAIGLAAPFSGESPAAWRRFKVTGWASGKEVSLSLWSQDPAPAERGERTKGR
ncbi:MAG TPA: hypothetical protein VEN81_03550 [Planctomycetota bacterium]|nr:hypothetical protein [Planctomycetota bacterium]